MPAFARMWPTTLLLLTAAAGPLGAQEIGPDDPPTPYSGLRPATREDRDRREALKLYVFGLLSQREDRFLEALQAYEKSLQLDPDAAPVYRATIPLYLVLEKNDAALTATRKALDLEPEDHETWFLYARQLRLLARPQEAIVALRKALACPRAKDRAEFVFQLSHDLGVLCESTHAPAEAIAAFTHAAEALAHPDHLVDLPPPARAEFARRAAETFERAGRLCLQLERHADAVSAFRKAQQAYPEGAGRLSYNLAQVCSQFGRHEEALAHLDTYLKLQPQGTEAYELKIDQLGKIGRGGDVLPWLEKAADGDQHNVRLKLLLAREYGKARQAEKAERVYVELAEKSPVTEVYLGLFRLYRAEPALGVGKVLQLLDATFKTADDVKDPGQAEAATRGRALLAALREDPQLGQDLLKGAPAVVAKVTRHETLQVLAVLSEKHNRAEQAERYYRLAIARAGEGARPLLYAGLLRVLWKERKYADIVPVCREGLRTAKDADCVVYHTELARALARLEQYDEALREADSAVSVASAADRFSVRHLRVRVLTQAGKYDRAEAECLALLKEHTLPGEVLEVRYLLSSVCMSAERTDRAEEQLQLCLKLDPDNPTVNNDLGYIWADGNKNLDQAETLIRRALELDRRRRKGTASLDPPDAEDNASYADSLGWVLYRKGDLAGARRELERAARLPDGDDPVIWDHLGDVYRRLGLVAEARRAWQRAAHYYEQGKRGRMERRHNELRQKLQLLQSETQPR